MTWLLLAEAGGQEIRLAIAGMVALAIGTGIWVIYALMGATSNKADERLSKFQGKAVAEAGGTGERLQDLLEKAAPALAKPLEPQTEQEQSDLKVRLSNAGWRNERAPTLYLGLKFICLIVGLIGAGAVVFPAYGFTQDGFLKAFMVAGIAFYLPAIVVGFCVKKRQEAIFLGLPDALDLMVVCVEAGLGLDAAMRKVCEEMEATFPIISEEFSICNFQLQVGRPRREVLHDLGIRTGVDDMKALAAILIQADRFGSSIGQALRVQSDSMRLRRKQLAEERAAKTAVQLIIPLVLFIFPAVFIVLVGPAGIQIAEAFEKM